MSTILYTILISTPRWVCDSHGIIIKSLVGDPVAPDAFFINLSSFSPEPDERLAVGCVQGKRVHRISERHVRLPERRKTDS